MQHSRILIATASLGAALSVITGVSAKAVSTHAASVAAPGGCVGPISATWLYVTVDGVRASEGLIAITLYADDPSTFLARNGSLYVGRVPAHAGTTRACVYLPKPGTYAVAVYHDANADKTFNRTGLGLPAEGYGFSNNPATFVGLPAFSSVRLNVQKANVTTDIQLKYP